MIKIIAFNALRESFRQRLILVAAVFALALAAASRLFLKLDLGHEQTRFVFDFSSGAFDFFGAIIAVALACGLFAAEVENRTIITLLSKPVGVFDFVAGKLCGVAAALGLWAAAVFAAAAVSLALTESAAAIGAETAGAVPVNYAGLALYCVCQWLKLCMCAAVAAAVCSLCGSFLFALAVSFLCVFASVMGEAVVGLGADSNWAVAAAAFLLPDFNLFDCAEKFVFANVDWRVVAHICGYAMVYCAAAAACAAFCYSRRDF